VDHKHFDIRQKANPSQFASEYVGEASLQRNRELLQKAITKKCSLRCYWIMIC